MNPKPSSTNQTGSASASGGDSLSSSSASPLRRFEPNNRIINNVHSLENGENEDMVPATVLQRNEIIVILHKIKKSVHDIIYYGDLTQKG
jgi:hypothetical protein